MVNGTLPWPCIDPEKALPWIEQKIGLALAESLVAAVRLALLSKVLVITGGPGVGKTTIVNAILRILAAKGVNLLLCAPTGRAAKRMTEASGFEAKTIHRLLEVDPRSGGFRRDARLSIIYQRSMIRRRAIPQAGPQFRVPYWRTGAHNENGRPSRSNTDVGTGKVMRRRLV